MESSEWDQGQSVLTILWPYKECCCLLKDVLKRDIEGSVQGKTTLPVGR